MLFVDSFELFIIDGDSWKNNNSSDCSLVTRHLHHINWQLTVNHPASQSYSLFQVTKVRDERDENKKKEKLLPRVRLFTCWVINTSQSSSEKQQEQLYAAEMDSFTINCLTHACAFIAPSQQIIKVTGGEDRMSFLFFFFQCPCARQARLTAQMRGHWCQKDSRLFLLMILPVVVTSLHGDSIITVLL